MIVLKPIRRIVTGHNAKGKSIIASDGPSPHVLTIPGVPTFGLTNLWVTDGAPADNSGTKDAADRNVVLEPPPSGTIFRVVEFPPDSTLAGTFDRKAAFEGMGAGHAMDQDASRHPGMHKTSTVDRARRRTAPRRRRSRGSSSRCGISRARRSVSLSGD